MGTVLALVTAVSVLAADQSSPPPDYGTHSADSQSAPPEVISWDALQDLLKREKEAGGGDDRASELPQGSTPNGKDPRDTRANSKVNGPESGGQSDKAEAGQNVSPLDSWLDQLRRSQLPMLPEGVESSPNDNKPAESALPPFPFGSGTDTSDAAAKAAAQAQQNWLQENGVISVGERPDGTRPPPAKAYLIWEERDGRMIPRPYTSAGDFNRDFQAINANPDRRAFRNEFESMDDLQDFIDNWKPKETVPIVRDVTPSRPVRPDPIFPPFERTPLVSKTTKFKPGDRVEVYHQDQFRGTILQGRSLGWVPAVVASVNSDGTYRVRGGIPATRPRSNSILDEGSARTGLDLYEYSRFFPIKKSQIRAR